MDCLIAANCCMQPVLWVSEICNAESWLKF